MVCDSLGTHCLSTARWAIHEYPSRRVDTDLLVQLKVGQRKLHCLSHLLLLDVHTTCEWRGGGKGENDGCIHKAAREFNIDRKRVREWDRKYNELQRMNAGAKRWKLCTGRTPLSPEERSEGRPLSNACLQAKAAEIGSGLCLSGFKSSSGWLWWWKRRNGVGMRCGTNSAQKVPADYADQLHHFRKSVIAVRKAKNIDPINMDQTMCRFDIPPKRTKPRKELRQFESRPHERRRKGLLWHWQQWQMEPNFRR